MNNYIYNKEEILSDKLLENFTDNLIPVDAIEIYSPCQKLTDKNSDKWTPKYIKKSGCAKKNERFLRGKNGGKTWKNGLWQKCEAEECKDDEENHNCYGRWDKCNKYCKRKFIIEREAAGSGICPFEKDKEYDCVDPLFNDEIQKGLQGECDFKNIPKEENKEETSNDNSVEEDTSNDNSVEEDTSNDNSVEESNINIMLIIIIILVLLIISLLFLYR